MRILVIGFALLAAGCAAQHTTQLESYAQKDTPVWTIDKACAMNPNQCPGAVEIRTPGPGPFFPY